MNPDWTVGIKLGRDRSGGFWVLDMVRQRANPGDVERLLLDTAMQDGRLVRIGFGRDPGQAGKDQAFYLVRALSGFTVEPASEIGDKLTGFGPFSSQCCAGNVKIRRGSWNEELFHVREGFPDLAHDDEVDACRGALKMLSPPMQSWGAFTPAGRGGPRRQQRKPKGAPPDPAPGSMESQALQERHQKLELIGRGSACRLVALSGGCLRAGSPSTAARTDRETEDVRTVAARNASERLRLVTDASFEPRSSVVPTTCLTYDCQSGNPGKAHGRVRSNHL